MKKILLILDAGQVDAHVLDFACYIAHLTHSKITGFFIEEFQEEMQPTMKVAYGIPYVETIVAEDMPDNQIRAGKYENNIRFFREACTCREINYTIHQVKNDTTEKLVAETRFADMIIIDGSFSYSQSIEHHLKKLLYLAECPILIAPFGFEGIDQVYFTYDGSRSAMHAIKLFTYLFPDLADKRITVLQVKETADTDLEEEEKIKTWLPTHYSNYELKLLYGEPEEVLSAYFLRQNKSLVVMGAFGRRSMAYFFKHSTAEEMLQIVNLPIFIAHA